MQSIISRRIDPFQQALITIGKLQGGEARNILAPNVHMEGTIRTFDEDTSFLIKKYMKDLLKGMETSHGIGGEFRELVYYPPVNNNQELTDNVRNIVPKEMLHPINPMAIAEDFSYFQQRVPGLFIFLGSRNEEKGYTHPLHSNQFQFDEEILLTGIQLNKNLLLS
jgi:metal-dependent amidase/aminoacylase/carboxypeptidase family protein